MGEGFRFPSHFQSRAAWMCEGSGSEFRVRVEQRRFQD